MTAASCCTGMMTWVWQEGVSLVWPGSRSLVWPGSGSLVSPDSGSLASPGYPVTGPQKIVIGVAMIYRKC